jgi:O-antigen/teichoic acid export membrane protein
MSEVRFTNLRHETVKGVSWSAVSQLSTQIFTWVISIILARILGPKAYGLIGMTAVFTGFAMLFSELGLGPAIVQRKNLEQRHLDSAFWITLLAGFVMTGLMGGFAPSVAWFYKEPRLISLTIAISLQFMLGALTVVQQAILRREMRFRTLGTIQITSTVAAGVIGLIMALSGMGVWSLVAQMLCGSMTRVILLWQVADWHPSWSFEMKATKELFSFSAYALAFHVVNYWARNADNLLIGRFIGAHALGIYARAYTLMLMPLIQITSVVSTVMTPALSSIQEDIVRVKRSYVKAVSVTGLVTFPMMVGFFVTSDDLILALLGQRWAEVIPIFKVLCGVGLLQSITTTTGWIYQSQGRTDLQFKVGLVISSGCVVAFLVGIHWGVLGVAWAYCVFSLLAWYPLWSFCGRIIGLHFGELVKTLLPTFVCATVMGGIVWATGYELSSSMSHGVRLLLRVPLGVLIYVALVAGFKLEAVREARMATAQVFAGILTKAGDPMRRCMSLRPWARVR